MGSLVSQVRPALEAPSRPPPPLRPGLPWPNWFLHCLRTGDSRPELSGDIERRPGSSAMVGGQAGRDEGPRGGRVAAAHCWCWAVSVSGGSAGLASSKNRGRVRLKSSSRVRGRAWGYRVLFCSAAWLHLELKLIGVADSTPTDAQAQAGTRCSRPCNEGRTEGLQRCRMIGSHDPAPRAPPVIVSAAHIRRPVRGSTAPRAGTVPACVAVFTGSPSRASIKDLVLTGSSRWGA